MSCQDTANQSVAMLHQPNFEQEEVALAMHEGGGVTDSGDPEKPEGTCWACRPPLG